MKRGAHILATILLAAGIAAGSPDIAAAKSCAITTISGNGSATSEKKARRNATIALISKIDHLYPGEGKSRMKGPVGYTCKNPLLWLCEASVKLCK
jgi:hypothetical protein